MAKKEYNYISIGVGRLQRYRTVTCVNKWFDNCHHFSFHLAGAELEIRKHYGDAPKFALKRNGAKSFTITYFDYRGARYFITIKTSDK